MNVLPLKMAKGLKLSILLEKPAEIMIPLIFIDNKLFYFHFAFTKIIQQFNVYLINKLNFSYLIKIIMNNTYIIDAVRTPVGRVRGST